ncbi:MAG: hypothetical protein R3199_05630 [Gemmatimonadota bacterium]|nr:hypothetical protein [Gemmatimonadota bacterium]
MRRSIRWTAAVGAVGVAAAAFAAPLADRLTPRGEVGSDTPLRVVVDRAELKWSSTGRLLGWLDSGARIEAIGGDEGWTRARVRGWMEEGALRPAGDGLAVRPEDASLHERPRGPRMGGLRRGVEVDRIGGDAGWIEIEMIGWLADSTLAEVPPAAAKESEAGKETGPEDGADASPLSVPKTVGRLADRVPLRGVPEGPVIANLPAGLVVRSGERRAGYTRVVVEGWVPSGSVLAGTEEDLAPDVVAAAEPGAFVGNDVSWTLEHVALQRADEWRRDFRAGETYDLARVPGGDGLYVYLAVPERLREEFERLQPFERIRIEGRVRTGRSELTGNPIVDVTRIEPS